MSELKPCPFCGARGSVEEEDPIGGYVVRCGNCSSQTPIYLRADLAIKAWNTRAERTCALPKTRIDHGSIEYNGVTEWRRCSSCGDEVLAYPAHYCPNCGAKVVE